MPKAGNLGFLLLLHTETYYKDLELSFYILFLLLGWTLWIGNKYLWWRGKGAPRLFCFLLWIRSALSTEDRIRSPVLWLLLWQFQVFIKNIWNHWTVILLGVSNTATNHFISKPELRAMNFCFEKILPSLKFWEFIVKYTYFQPLTTTVVIYKINRISLLCPPSHSRSTRGVPNSSREATHRTNKSSKIFQNILCILIQLQHFCSQIKFSLHLLNYKI